MLSFDAVDAAINARMADGWDVSRYGPVVTENVTEDPADAFSFIRLYIRKSQRPMGGNGPGTREGRVRGQIVFVSYGPVGQGKGIPSQLIDAAREIFEEQTFSSNGIAVRVEFATDEVSSPNQPWYQVMVVLPFWAQSV